MLLGQFFQTGWLNQLFLPAAGLIFLAWGLLSRRLRLILPGSLLAGVGLGIWVALNPGSGLGLPRQAGAILIGFALGWALITPLATRFTDLTARWALIPASILASLGGCLTFSSLRLVDFALYVLTGVAVMFLVWGLWTRLIGLIIPGAVLIGIGPGIYTAWGSLGQAPVNVLAQTGVMLVYFSIGWGLITLFSRLLKDKFVWWPLIPGGVIAVTGCGLYLGGDPHNALSFIGNTGSVGLILFGLYLLLWRWGLRR